MTFSWGPKLDRSPSSVIFLQRAAFFHFNGYVLCHNPDSKVLTVLTFSCNVF